MFFIISKIVGLALKPLTLMLAAGVIAFFTKRPKVRKVAVRTGAALFLICTNPWLISVLSGWWETGRRSPEDIRTPYEVGIVLGGYSELLVAAPVGVSTFSRSGNRLSSALMLYKTGKIKHILLSGGSGRILGSEKVEALEAKRYLTEVGVPDSAIWVEARSRNTRENASYSKILLDSLAPQQKCLLITSAWHMRRAEKHFTRAGVLFDPFGTDYFGEKSEGNPFHWLEPDWKALMKWECLIKEWVGYFV